MPNIKINLVALNFPQFDKENENSLQHVRQVSKIYCNCSSGVE